MSDTPPAHQAADFRDNQTRGDSLGLFAGSIGAGKFVGQKQANRTYNFCLVSFLIKTHPDQLTSTESSDERGPHPAQAPAHVQTRTQTYPEAADAGNCHEEQARARKYERDNKRMASGNRTCMPKRMWLAVIVTLGLVVILVPAIGYGTHLFKQTGDQGQSAQSSSFLSTTTQSPTNIPSPPPTITSASSLPQSQLFTSATHAVDVSTTQSVSASTTVPIKITTTTTTSPEATSKPRPASTLLTAAKFTTPTLSFYSSSSSQHVTTATVASPTPACACEQGCPAAACSDNNGCCDPLVCMYSSCHYVTTTAPNECIYGIAGTACGPDPNSPCCDGYHCDRSISQCVLG